MKAPRTAEDELWDAIDAMYDDGWRLVLPKEDDDDDS